MALLVSNSFTPAWNFFDADKNELNEEGSLRTIAILNDRKSYTIKVTDFPLNKNWEIYINDEEIPGTGCYSLGDAICWVESFIDNKKVCYHTKVIEDSIRDRLEIHTLYTLLSNHYTENEITKALKTAFKEHKMRYK